MNRFDEHTLYCRSLGHHIKFKYCRTMAEGMPCSKIRDCNFEQLPIDDFLKEHYTYEEISAFLKPPKNRVFSILEIIDKVKKQ